MDAVVGAGVVAVPWAVPPAPLPSSRDMTWMQPATTAAASVTAARLQANARRFFLGRADAGAEAGIGAGAGSRRVNAVGGCAGA